MTFTGPSLAVPALVCFAVLSTAFAERTDEPKRKPTPMPEATAKPRPKTDELVEDWNMDQAAAESAARPKFKKRAVKLDLEGEEPTKDDRLAIAIIKKMKWSLDMDPTQAAWEDINEFYRVTDEMKAGRQLDFYVLLTGASTFDKSKEIATQLKAAGMSAEKISELQSENTTTQGKNMDPANPFSKNPMWTYVNVVHEAFDKVKLH